MEYTIGKKSEVRNCWENVPRGTWVLVRIYDPHDNLKEWVSDKIVDNASYVIWKDRKVIIFYTNDPQSELSVDMIFLQILVRKMSQLFVLMV